MCIDGVIQVCATLLAVVISSARGSLIIGHLRNLIFFHGGPDLASGLGAFAKLE